MGASRWLDANMLPDANTSSAMASNALSCFMDLPRGEFGRGVHVFPSGGMRRRIPAQLHVNSSTVSNTRGGAILDWIRRSVFRRLFLLCSSLFYESNHLAEAYLSDTTKQMSV